jgi:hypothetical protein
MSKSNIYESISTPYIRWVSHMKRAITFYTNILGLKPLVSTPYEESR